MDITESKRDLHIIIEQIPDDSMEDARRLLRELLESRVKAAPERRMTPEEHLQWLNSLPEEDYEMTDGEKVSMVLGEEDMKAGRVVPWEQVEKEIDQ